MGKGRGQVNNRASRTVGFPRLTENPAVPGRSRDRANAAPCSRRPGGT